MKLYIFSRDWKILTGKGYFFKYSHDEMCIIFDGEAKISTGKQQKHDGENF